MDAGKLTKRITIEKQEKIRAPSGQVKAEWVPYKTIWAQMKCTDSKTVSAEGLVQHEGLYRFYIRHCQGITAEMRVKYQGRTFLLVGPPADWDGEKIGLTLICREMS